jgi:hypothetical protein
MLCDRCQSKDAVVHISAVLHAGPTPHADHLCTECAQISLATNPLLSPRNDHLPTVGAPPVMLLPSGALADRIAKYQARFEARTSPNRTLDRITRAAVRLVFQIRRRWRAPRRRSAYRRANVKYQRSTQ